MPQTPEKILERWLEHVNRLEADSAAGLYDEKSVLLPTFSPHALSKPLQISEYFRQLATREGLRVELHTETVRKTETGDGTCILTGIYSFHFAVDDANLTFPSRFTFFLDTSRERPILHHHSSQIPRNLS